MSEEIVNKVATSGLITLNLEDMRDNGERVLYDIKQNLFQELILKEKDFRAFIKKNDWSVYEGKNVAITCTAEAIVPTWAYMLLMSAISPYADHVVFGDLEDLEQSLFQKTIDSLDPEDYRDQRLVIKGCGDEAVPIFAYTEIVRKLQPVAKSIMYGEPCSTVPVFKKRV